MTTHATVDVKRDSLTDGAAQRLGAPPPEGDGRSGLLQRIDEYWAAHMRPAMGSASQ